MGPLTSVVLIWGQHLHVWPACPTVGRFTARWMDIGSMWSIKHQSDICLAFYSMSGALLLSLMAGKRKGQRRKRKQNFLISWVCLAHVELAKQRGTSFPVSNGSGIPSTATVLNTSLANLGFCSICKSSLLTPTVLSWEAQLFQTGNQLLVPSTADV